MGPIDDLRSMIEVHGWAVRNVSDADPEKCISYTVGLSAHGHPEAVMTGLPPEVGTAFLDIVGEIVVREHGRFAAGEATTKLADGPPMPVLPVADKSDSPPSKRSTAQSQRYRSSGPTPVAAFPGTRTTPRREDHSGYSASKRPRKGLGATPRSCDERLSGRAGEPLRCSSWV
jgi:hypothetical protein